MSEYKWDGVRYISRHLANQKAKLYRGSGFKAKVVIRKLKNGDEYKVCYKK